MLKKTLGSRYEEVTRFFYHISGMPNSMRPFPMQNKKAFDDEFAHVTQYAQ